MAFYQTKVLALVAGAAPVDLLPGTGFDFFGTSGLLSIWASGDNPLTTTVFGDAGAQVSAELKITPPSEGQRSIIAPGYLFNVGPSRMTSEGVGVVASALVDVGAAFAQATLNNNFSTLARAINRVARKISEDQRVLIDDDLVVLRLPVPGDSQLQLLAKSDTAVNVRVILRRDDAPVDKLSGVVVDGGLTSLAAGVKDQDLLVSSVLRKRPSASLLTLMATAEGPGNTVRVRIVASGDAAKDIIGPAFPINPRYASIVPSSDTVIAGFPVEGNAQVQWLASNPSAGALSIRWRAISVT